MKILIVLTILAVAYLLYRAFTAETEIVLPAQEAEIESQLPAEPVVKTMSNSAKAAIGISIVAAAVVAAASPALLASF
jgi:hypothetical protein